jgi:hypothetical protein
MASLMVTSTAFAQQRHVAGPSALKAAVAAQVDVDTKNRAVVRDVLKQNEVREVAGRLGLDITRAENAVATMNSADVALAGGSNTIIISTTTLLLILIIVLLVAD